MKSKRTTEEDMVIDNHTHKIEITAIKTTKRKQQKSRKS